MHCTRVDMDGISAIVCTSGRQRRVYAEQSLSNLRCAMAAFEGADLADAEQRAGHQQ